MAHQSEDSPSAGGAPDDAPSNDRLARWEHVITARRPLLRRLGFAFSLTIIAISAIIFLRAILRVDPRHFQDAFTATGGDQIAMAFALSAVSYLALTGYDGLALRHLRVRVPYR